MNKLFIIFVSTKGSCNLKILFITLSIGGSCNLNKLFIIFVSVVSSNYMTIFHSKIKFVHRTTILTSDPTLYVTENLILPILRSSISNVGTATSHQSQPTTTGQTSEILTSFKFTRDQTFLFFLSF